jgi:hypothetical protein
VTKLVAFLLGLVGYTLLSILALILLAGPPYASWQLAESKLEPGVRLRSHYRVDKPVTAGSKLRRSDIEHRFGYLESDVEVVHASAIVGRFAVKTIASGTIVTEETVKQRHMIVPANDSIVAQVRVAAEYVEGISPGMHLAFIREKTIEMEDENGNQKSETKPEIVGLPTCDDTARKGLPVVAIVVTEGDPPPTLIDVELHGENAQFASQLTIHEWRPIVLGVGACQK